LSVEYLLQVAEAARVRMPKREMAVNSLEKLQRVGLVSRVVLVARSHREMRPSLVVMEQLMLAAAAAVIGAVEAEAPTAVVVVGLRT
jgi:hypothetical protein